MSDPLSVAASAAGLLSLGIEVYKGLKWYLVSVKGRKEEIQHALRDVEKLHPILSSLHPQYSSLPLSSSSLAPSPLLSTLAVVRRIRRSHLINHVRFQSPGLIFLSSPLIIAMHFNENVPYYTIIDFYHLSLSTCVPFHFILPSLSIPISHSWFIRLC